MITLRVYETRVIYYQISYSQRFKIIIILRCKTNKLYAFQTTRNTVECIVMIENCKLESINFLFFFFFKLTVSLWFDSKMYDDVISLHTVLSEG